MVTLLPLLVLLFSLLLKSLLFVVLMFVVIPPLGDVSSVAEIETESETGRDHVLRLCDGDMVTLLLPMLLLLLLLGEWETTSSLDTVSLALRRKDVVKTRAGDLDDVPGDVDVVVIVNDGER
jgi:hypothetical protein